jgi:folate-dependent phosphoribosylglycinamide formyltransferase PurN
VNKARVAVLISGSGSNLQALIDASRDGVLNAEIVLVVSNRKAAFGLTRAKNAGIETLYFPLKPYRDAGHTRVLPHLNLTYWSARVGCTLILAH